MSTTPPLGQGAGYGIVLGLGFFFAFAMILVTWMLKRYNAEVQTSEMFSTAGHSVKSGLVASSVVSSWTWSATLLRTFSGFLADSQILTWYQRVLLWCTNMVSVARMLLDPCYV
jgi:Na+/proline symporter